MEADEVVLSEVHLQGGEKLTEARCINNYGDFVTEFKFWLDEGIATPYLDEDGDYIVRRKCDLEKMDYRILIEHTLATRLEDVGLQIWAGCILLCDYVLSEPGCFVNKTVLELGAGTGMLSLFLASYADHVISTDKGDTVLRTCQENLKKNVGWKNKCVGADSLQSVSVRELDWFNPELKSGGAYGWSDADQRCLSEVEVIVAADVIYSDDLTDAFFHVIFTLLLKPPSKRVYIALEKRINFTIHDLDMACPAYDHFIEGLEHLGESVNSGSIKMTYKEVETDFPEHFYQCPRNKYMELWQIVTEIKV